MIYLNTVSIVHDIGDISVDINRVWRLCGSSNIEVNPHDFLKNYTNKPCVVTLHNVGGGPLGNVLDILLHYKCKYTFLVHNGDNPSSHFFNWNPKFLEIPGKKYFVNADSINAGVYGIPIGINLWANSQLEYHKDKLKCIEIASKEVDVINETNIQRKLQIYNDYHTTTAYWPSGDFNIRLNCLKFMKENSEKFRQHGIDVIFTEGRVKQPETFRRYRESTFVLSPPGNGYDCHRHLEALVFGAIPIIIKTKLLTNTTYDGLPILELDKVEDLTPDVLFSFMKTFKIDRHKLTVEYWKNKIRNN